ncbi:MAG: NAD-dependent epimerase/dehydratase family protein [Planctomycetes bacterium]|nr:NAD-dependent epimerase/dehydratase family protein [Planctomycetota bacterium]
MKVLVTGATGNVGSCLVRRLVTLGHEVSVLCRATSDRRALGEAPRREFIGDLTESVPVREACRGQEAVFHVGAVISYRRRDAAKMYQANVLGTRNVVEGCLAGGVRRLVHTSSVAAVGIPRRDRPADETLGFHADARRIGYFRTKWEAEQEVWSGVSRGLDAVAVNPGVIWGSSIGLNSARLLRRAAEDRLPAMIPGGVTVVDMEDVVEGHLLALDRGRRGERYILGAGMLLWSEILRATAAITGQPAPSIEIPASILYVIGVLGEAWSDLTGGRSPEVTLDIARCTAHRLFYDSSKARRELGWSPRPFAETLRRTLERL